VLGLKWYNNTDTIRYELIYIILLNVMIIEVNGRDCLERGLSLSLPYTIMKATYVYVSFM